MVKTLRKYAFAGTAILALSACATDEPAADDAAASPETAAADEAAARQAIGAANTQWEEAYSSGDLAAQVGLYAEDGTLMPPNMETAQGRAAIQQVFEGARQMGVTAFDLETVELQVAGDFAYEVGRYTAYAQPEGAPEPVAVDNGKYIVVWKQQADGSWKLFRDIYNSSMPAPAGH